MIYLQLFWAFFQIGLFSFGGGYAALPLISQQVISIYHWISQNTFTDLITISQMTPGPIAVNSSTFVGQYVAHLPGALIATFGCILPSCILVSLLAYFYVKYKDMKVMKTILSYLKQSLHQDGFVCHLTENQIVYSLQKQKMQIDNHNLNNFLC